MVRSAALVLASLLGGAPVLAADPTPPHRDPVPAMPVRTLLPAPLPPPVAVPVVVPLVVPLYRDPRTGRCLAGFAEDEAGVCKRHDEPTLACWPEPEGTDVCAVAPPNPAPYGPGPRWRLNY